MSEMPAATPPAPEQPEDPYVKDIREKAGYFFDEPKELEVKKAILESAYSPYADYLGPEIGEPMMRKVSELCDIPEREKFVEAFMDATQPILDLRERDLETYERLQRVAQDTSDPREAASDLITYEISKDVVEIHLSDTFEAPNYKDLKGRKKAEAVLADFERALVHLAEVFKEHPKLSRINAVSFLVESHPELFERYGFDVAPEKLQEEDRLRLFGTRDTRAVREANMRRDVLLERYGQK